MQFSVVKLVTQAVQAEQMFHSSQQMNKWW